jgi:hypothetical protein
MIAMPSILRSVLCRDKVQRLGGEGFTVAARGGDFRTNSVFLTHDL